MSNSLRAVALVMALLFLAQGAQAAAAESTVILLLEGVDAGALERRRPDGSPLMPHLSRLAEESLVFTDAFSESPQSLTGLWSLITARAPMEFHGHQDSVRGLGLLTDHRVELWGGTAEGMAALTQRLPWLVHRAAPDADAATPVEQGRQMLDQVLASEAGSPRVALVLIEAALPPLLVSPEESLRFDTTPWHLFSGDRSHQLQARSRHRLAQMVPPDPAQWNGRPYPVEPFLRSVDAAQARADSVLGHLVARIEARGLRNDVDLIVTATRGMARGERRRYGPRGVSLRQVHVPLIWRPAAAMPPRRVQAPVVLADVAVTLANVRAGTSLGECVDVLADRASVSTERRCIAAGEVRWSDGDITLIGRDDGTIQAFDRRVDPGEFEDLFPRQPRERQVRFTADLMSPLYGRARDVWILVKTETSTAVKLAVRSGATIVAARGLESAEGELVRDDSTLVRFAAVAGPQGAGLRLELAGPEPDLTVELEPPALALPVFLGRGGEPEETPVVELRRHREPLFRALVRTPGEGLSAWARQRPAGIYVWIVPRD